MSIRSNPENMLMKYQMPLHLFHLDALAYIMIGVILTIGATVTCFSSRYMRGDKHYCSFLVFLITLVLLLAAMVCANNLFLLLALWSLCNASLINLMVHESKWYAARASGKLTAKTFLLGFFCIGSGFLILYFDYKSASIYSIVHAQHQSPNTSIALILIFIGAMTQSGLWPFIVG